MNIEDYLNKMNKIQEQVLKFIDSEDNSEENYRLLNKFFDELKIRENKHDSKSLLHLLLNISNNHHREHGFYDRIGLFLNIFKDEIKKTYSNYIIFNMFKSNKRMLLLLSELEIMTINEEILDSIEIKKYISLNYIHYFLPEIKHFFDIFNKN